MDFLSPLCNNITFPTLACTFMLLFFLCKLLFLNHKRHGHNQKLAPELPGARPIIGHLHLLIGSVKPTHLIFASMADKYGPIFRIRLGNQQTLVVSNSEIAKECFTTNDKVLATRPKTLASQIMGYNSTILAVAPYGAYLRKIRKVLAHEMLSGSRIELLRPKRESQMRKSIKRTFDHWSKNNDAVTGAVTVEMKEWFGRLIMNLSVSLIFGEQKEEEESKVQQSIRRMMELFAEPVVADFFPWLRWLDIGGHEKAMIQTAMEMDSFAERCIEEHRRKRNLTDQEEDFMDIMLSVFDRPAASNQSLPDGYDTDVVIKSTCLSVLIGAADTSIVTMTWALCLILNNYNVLERIHDELDTHVGKKRQVEESDLKQLIYLQAVIKETLRLYPPAPLLVPHAAMEDCTIDGYHIQKGTQVLFNIAKIHRDPIVWVESDTFKPERFLTSHFELIPFSSGRRICPGVALGLQTMQLTLASLFHCFDTRRLSNEPIELNESPGVTNFKATPLQVLFIPRLASNLYV